MAASPQIITAQNNPQVFSRTKSAYHGADPERARKQLLDLQTMWKDKGPKAFMFHNCWIQPKPPEKGERRVTPTYSTKWNRSIIPFYLNTIQCDIERKLGNRNIFLKPRQGGYTTYMIIRRLFLQCILNPGHNGLLIAQKSVSASGFFRILRRCLNSFGMFDPNDRKANTYNKELHQNLLHTTYSSRRELVFDQLDVVITCDSAEVEEVGQGFCLHPNTWIQTADNRYIRFKELQVGDWVIGSKGLPVEITKTFRIPANKHPYKGEARRIYLRGLSKKAIVAAPNHPFMTARGMVEAKDLTTGDFFAYPRRKLVCSRKYEHLDMWPYGQRRRKIFCEEPEMKLDRDLGLVCGLYLADGFMGGNGSNHALIKMVAPRKKKYALKRILKRMKTLVENPHHHKTILYLHSTIFGKWIKDNFGWAKTKHVPLWWADAPKEFIVGLLEGWLVGDAYWKNTMIEGYGTNPAIVLPMKEMAVALGAMPYCQYRNGRRHKVEICGRAAMSCGKRIKLTFKSYAHARLVELFSLKNHITKPNLRRKSQWYDENYVYIRIDKNKESTRKRI